MKKIISCVLSILMIVSVFVIDALAFDYSQIACSNEWQLLELLNDRRKTPVTMLAALQDASHTRSAELLSCLSHYRPDNTAWYSVLNEKGIGYNTDSFELIAANFDSPSKVFNALMCDNLLSDIGHVGIGYASSASEKNKQAWNIIGISCSGISSVSVHYADIHLTAGDDLASVDIILEATCEHGKSYMPVPSSMITGYDTEKIGIQILTVSYKGKTAELVITNDYKDVKLNQWYYDAIMNCTQAGYYAGVGNGNFNPRGTMTREMFVTVLGRFAGVDGKKYTGSSFSDVKTGRWSSPYIEWAAMNGIVSGYNDSTFRGAQGVTRQEMCSMVKRYVDKYGIVLDQTNAQKIFTDSTLIASWARDAIIYCQTRGIISGDSKGAFNPKNTATRAEVAVIVTNLERITK